VDGCVDCRAGAEELRLTGGGGGREDCVVHTRPGRYLSPQPNLIELARQLFRSGQWRREAVHRYPERRAPVPGGSRRLPSNRRRDSRRSSGPCRRPAVFGDGPAGTSRIRAAGVDRRGRRVAGSGRARAGDPFQSVRTTVSRSQTSCSTRSESVPQSPPRMSSRSREPFENIGSARSTGPATPTTSPVRSLPRSRYIRRCAGPRTEPAHC
jgi:hypothetical protein